MTTWQDEARNWLLHDGKPGMHWGHRRYRNYDGTLTPAGRERYGVGPPRDAVSNVTSKLSRKERKAQKEIQRKASAEYAEKKAKEASKESKKAADEARKAQEELRKEREDLDKRKAKEAEGHATAEENAQKKLDNDRATMDNAQLRAAIDRLKLEREYDALVNPPKPPKEKTPKVSTMDRVMQQMDNIKNITARVNDVVGVAKEIKKLVKGDGNEAYNALKLKSDMDKLRYDMEARDRSRAKWFKDDADDKAKAEKAKAAAEQEKLRAEAQRVSERTERWRAYQEKQKNKTENTSSNTDDDHEMTYEEFRRKYFGDN